MRSPSSPRVFSIYRGECGRRDNLMPLVLVLLVLMRGVSGAISTPRELNPLQPQLARSLLCVWLVVFVSLVFGKQVLAKIT